jgi:hypothetical protein
MNWYDSKIQSMEEKNAKLHYASWIGLQQMNAHKNALQKKAGVQ